MPICCPCSKNSKEKNSVDSEQSPDSDQPPFQLSKVVSKTKKKNSLEDKKMSLVHHVQDKDDYDNQLKEAGSKLVVVDFYATWCGPCKMISPKLEEMAQQYTDVCFLKVDVDDCDDVASLYNISCMPTFILIKNTEKIQEFSGANADKLKELILSNK